MPKKSINNEMRNNEAKKESEWLQLLKHPLLLLLIGSLLTYGVGETIRNSYQTRQAKAAFSLRVVQLSWNQLFWTRVYVNRTNLNLPKPELDYAWNKYIDSLEQWNTELMGNIQLLEKYYDSSTRAEFETEIQPALTEINNLLIDLRYSDEKPTIDEINKKVDAVNAKLVFFRQIECRVFAINDCQ
jgi:hypothetical protein